MLMMFGIETIGVWLLGYGKDEMAICDVTEVNCTVYVYNVAYANDVDTRATESSTSRRIRDYGES
jgi:predicted ThiF/HesA family dinucleotide-utilizing enzyme